MLVAGEEEGLESEKGREAAYFASSLWLEKEEEGVTVEVVNDCCRCHSRSSSSSAKFFRLRPRGTTPSETGDAPGGKEGIGFLSVEEGNGREEAKTEGVRQCEAVAGPVGQKKKRVGSGGSRPRRNEEERENASLEEVAAPFIHVLLVVKGGAAVGSRDRHNV